MCDDDGFDCLGIGLILLCIDWFLMFVTEMNLMLKGPLSMKDPFKIIYLYFQLMKSETKRPNIIGHSSLPEQKIFLGVVLTSIMDG